MTGLLIWLSVLIFAVVAAESIRRVMVINDREAMYDDPDEPEARP